MDNSNLVQLFNLSIFIIISPMAIESKPKI